MQILTDEEIKEIRRACLDSKESMHYARAIEAKIMERIGEPIGEYNGSGVISWRGEYSMHKCKRPKKLPSGTLLYKIQEVK